MRALIVEDDVDIAEQLAKALRKAMYVVDIAHDGEEGEFLGNTENYDVILLDIGLPKRDGLSVLQAWRSSGIEVPVLILTARDTWREKVAGLRAGADDYLAKPFEFEEMLARVEAIIRRSAGHASSLIELGPLVLDVGAAHLTVDKRAVDLTALEFRTLVHLMQNSKRVISKIELTEHLYEQDFDRDSNVIEVLINRLRKKLGADLIKTYRGLGYQIIDPDKHA